MQLAPFTAKKTLFVRMLFILTCSTVFMTVTARAHNMDALNTAVKVSKQEKVNIPVVAGARVFAKFDDSMPAVINYFTPLAEDKIIAFYNESYGQPTKQTRKRGRLTLHYQQASQQIRVVISQQSQLRQVDVIVDSRAAKRTEKRAKAMTN